MKTGIFQTHTSTSYYPLHYKIWGDDNPHTLVCVAGLLGHSDDFKFVGEYLSTRGYRVVALDMPGRGLSAYFENPEDYCYRQYVIDMTTFLGVIGCTAPASCDWFGVSMGGLLGIRLAGMTGTPIRRLILSDVGPEVPQFDLDFISKVMKLTPEYDRPEDAIPILKMSLGTPYSRGPMTETQWSYLVHTALKKRADGKYIRNFDPNLSVMFDREPLGELDLWPLWERFAGPVLAVRGGLSTLFPARVPDDMRVRKSGVAMDLVTIPDCGHVPSFFPLEHIEIIADWLARTEGLLPDDFGTVPAAE